MTDSTYAVPSGAAGIQRLAAGIGVVGLGVCAFGFTSSPEQFYRAWLIAFLFWWGVSLGSLAWMMIHHLSGGQWGVVTRRVFEASSRTLPLMALVFLPVAFGVRYLYPWARPEEVATDAILQHRAAYLNRRLQQLVTDAPAGAIDPVALGEVTQLLHAFRARSRSTQHRMAAGDRLGAETSIDKVLLATVEQSVFDLALDALGPEVALGDDPEAHRWRTEYLYSRAATIYGGSAEIQRNIIARRLLDLGDDR